jgi:acyl transferase domain-containing protein
MPGRVRTRRGAFLSDTDKFDAQFFAIPDDEAAQTDPKQRLLLEVAWEALEDAGLPLDGREERDLGVFVGLSAADYAAIQNRHYASVGHYTSVGVKCYMGANRLSYQFNLTGPSIVCDTACSTGMTALGIACDAIWAAAPGRRSVRPMT